MCSEYINHWYNWEGKWSLNENENLHLDLIQLEMTTCMHDLQLLTGWANSQVDPTGKIVYEVECAQNRATNFVWYWLKVQLVPTDASPVAYNFLNSSVSYEVEYSFFLCKQSISFQLSHVGHTTYFRIQWGQISSQDFFSCGFLHFRLAIHPHCKYFLISLITLLMQIMSRSSIAHQPTM